MSTNEIERAIEDHERFLERGRELLDRFRSLIEKHCGPEKPEQWEPEGGNYFVDSDGNVEYAGTSFPETSEFGVERPVEQHAEQARDLMRTHNRALAYVQEHAPDWDGGDPHTVHYFGGYLVSPWNEGIHPPIGSVIGPEWVMQKLADDLNSGRVKL